MEISKLRLRNFKGIEEKTIEFSHNTDIFGANKAGKTTVADAVSFLLFDKDSQGNSKFEIKPLDNENNVIHNLESEVCGIFENRSGPVELKKIYKEKYTKRRGSLDQELTGHTTEYYIDGVSRKMGEYKAKVSEIATTERIFQLLTGPTFFSVKLDWKKQRELLVEVCGDISDIDVLDSMATVQNKSDIANLTNIINARPLGDHKLIVAGRRKKINEQIKDIPGRIDEKTRSLPELKVTNPEQIIKKLGDLRDDLSKKNTEISTVKNGGGVAKLRLNLVEIDGKLQEIANDHQKKTDAAAQSKRDEMAKMKDELSDINASIKFRVSAKAMLEADIANETDTVAALNTKWRIVTSSTFVSISPCSHCGALPEHHLNFTPEKFNEQKAQQVEKIVADGTAAANKKKDLENFLAINAVQLAEVEVEKTNKGKEIEAFFVALPEDLVENDPDHRAWIANKATIKEHIKEAEAGSSGLTEKAEQEKTAIEEEIKTNEKYISDIETSQKDHDRIAELKAEQKKLSAEYEQLEGELFLIEKFIRAKVSMLESKINDKFSFVKFKLFSEQVNGGLAECCEVMVDGVPYGSLNSAARIQAGCDIINTLSDYYGVVAPVIIDSRESVTEIPEMRCQVISLIVSPEDSVLRVEAA